MQLTTYVPLSEMPFHITYDSLVFFIGSCFSDVLGAKLRERKFEVLSNPFGTVYNPVSMAKMMQNIIRNDYPELKEIQQYNDIFFHPDFHSDMSSMSLEECCTNIQQATNNAHAFIKAARCIFITFGTAYVYEDKKTGQIVANNHKLPASLFDKKLLTVEEICRTNEEMIHLLRQSHPDIPVVFTISPVRHIRDGLIENNRSKARLLEAVHLIRESLSGVFYFPSYELVMDQLRDYRYYEKDMIHPNGLAHDVIWNFFSDTFFDNKTKQTVVKTEKIMAAFHHKPRFRQHPDFVRFCQKQVEEIDSVYLMYPRLDFSKEADYFNNYSNNSD